MDLINTLLEPTTEELLAYEEYIRHKTNRKSVYLGVTFIESAHEKMVQKEYKKA